MAKPIFWNYFINPIVQVITILIVTIALYLMSLFYLTQARIFDPAPGLQAVTNLDSKTKIRTGLFVSNFLNFDLIKNDFELLGTVWFEFNKNDVDLAMLEQAVFSKGELEPHLNLHEDPLPIVQEQDGLVFAQYPVRVNFASNLNHKLFPFDSHRLYLSFNNMHLDSEKFAFVTKPDQFVLSDNATTFGWLAVEQQVHSGYITKQLANDKTVSYPRVLYSIDFIRNSFKDVLLLLLPLLVTFFMSMFTFSYDHEVYRSSILSVGVATVSAMVGYRFVINNAAPKVPYFMLVDWLFVLFLLLGFTVFLINVFNLFKNYRGLIILILHTILVSSWYTLLYIWG